MLTDTEKQLIAYIQGDIPLTERPFLEIARKMKMEEADVLDLLNDLTRRGVIRRFGATLYHDRSGYRANAMAAWVVDEDRIDRVGEKMAGFQEVTHCYRRIPNRLWPFNLYTMIHARSEDGCRELAAKLSEATGETRYSLLFSRKELKKTTMQYFSELYD